MHREFSNEDKEKIKTKNENWAFRGVYTPIERRETRSPSNHGGDER